jgi:hypothetical protein
MGTTSTAAGTAASTSTAAGTAASTSAAAAISAALRSAAAAWSAVIPTWLRAVAARTAVVAIVISAAVSTGLGTPIRFVVTASRRYDGLPHIKWGTIV